MKLFFLVVLTALLPTWCVAAPANANTADTSARLIADLPSEAALAATELLADARSERKRYLEVKAAVAKLDAGQLNGLVGPNPEQLLRDNGKLIDVAERPLDPTAWRALHEFMRGRQDHRRASGAAWQVLNMTVNPELRAQWLLRMADDFAAMGQPGSAIKLAKLAVAAAPTANNQNALAAIESRLRFRVLSIEGDGERELPQACVVMSRRLHSRQPLPIADLVSVEPAGDYHTNYQNDRVCVQGLTHGEGYRIKLHAGLLSDDGATLEQAQEQGIAIENRAPKVVFTPNTYVLPRGPNGQIPIRTINLAEVPLELYRITETNLVNASLLGTLDADLAAWDRINIQENSGQQVWKGVLEVANQLNEEVITNIPLQPILAKVETGVYALVSPQGAEWQPAATQWLVVSNLGLSSLQAMNGLHLTARRLDDAQPQRGVSLKLMSRNNRVLAEARTGGDGVARFDAPLLRGKGGDAPALVVATLDEDFNFLRLTSAALDLSERGAEGRAAPGAVDAYLYSDRGIYRPGETIRLSALVRDHQAKAMANTPVRLRVIRPGGVLMVDRPLTSDALGAVHTDIELSTSAYAGVWSASLLLTPDDAAIGNLNFQVEDFVPPRIEVKADFRAPQLAPDSLADIDISARFYHGALGADLAAGGQIRIEVNDTPFEAYKTFRFGRIESDFRPISVALASVQTNDQGKAHLQAKIPIIADRNNPLQARLIANVFDVGGRPVIDVAQVPIRLHERYVGIRSKNLAFAETEAAQHEFVVVDAEGAPVANRNLEIHWVREHYDYTWYSDNGTWNYRTIVRDDPVATETTNTDSKGRASAQRLLPPGQYRIEAVDAAGTAVASSRFDVGWWFHGEAANVPDALTLRINETNQREDRVAAFVQAPFAGRAQVVIANENILDHFDVDLPKEGTTLTVDLKDDYSPGVYLMVTAIRPDVGQPSPLPVRAVGLKWVPVGVEKRTLNVSLAVPEHVAPRQKIEVPVTVSNAANESIGLTLAAVDEGVLSLTQFPSPNPAQHYFSQRLFFADARDLYGNLIAPKTGPTGNLRSGGDRATENLAGLRTRSSRVVALFHHRAALDANGKATVALTLPDFNGRLRLMAVAYGAEKLGAGESPLVVRDPIVADLILPRFLAPKDEARATLDLRNTESQVANLQLRLAATSSGDDAKAPVQVSLAETSAQLAPQGNRQIPVTLMAKEPGVATFKLTANLADGREINREFSLEVRSAAPYQTVRNITAVAAGATIRVDRKVLTPMFNDRTRATLTSGLTIDMKTLLDDLQAYPYGCTEQVISQMLPQLSLTSDSQGNQVRSAIATLLDRQRSDGAFGTWSPTSEAWPWLTPYAYDFLQRAADAKFDVPTPVLQQTESYLRNNFDSFDPQTQAYAAYVLARTGAIKPADVRRFLLNSEDRLMTRMAFAQAGAAAAIIGDVPRSRALFDRAAKTARGIWQFTDYGSDRRDAAGLLALMSEHLPSAASPVEVMNSVEAAVTHNPWLSTQELAWLSLAGAQIAKQGAAMNATVAGTRHTEPRYDFELSASQLIEGVSITNEGEQPIRLLTSQRGQPLQAPAPVANGYTLSRVYLDPITGQAIAGDRLKQGQVVLVLISGKSERTTAQPQQTLITDLLPAGFEIENGKLVGTFNGNTHAFLGYLSPVQIETARDDRYVAAVNLMSQQSFRVAYTARAVTPGVFELPGPSIEDMYDPQFRANGASSRLIIE